MATITSFNLHTQDKYLGYPNLKLKSKKYNTKKVCIQHFGVNLSYVDFQYSGGSDVNIPNSGLHIDVKAFSVLIDSCVDYIFSPKGEDYYDIGNVFCNRGLITITKNNNSFFMKIDEIDVSYIFNYMDIILLHMFLNFILTHNNR